MLMLPHLRHEILPSFLMKMPASMAIESSTNPQSSHFTVMSITCRLYMTDTHKLVSIQSTRWDAGKLIRNQEKGVGMKDSDSWLIMTFLLVVIAVLAIFLRGYLSSDPMFVEMLATLFGVLIAISFSESIRNDREEKRAKSVEDDLINEVRVTLENAERPFIRELTSATWISVRARGIPDRIEPELRRALANVFELFEICNYSIRQKEEYGRTTDPDAKKMDTLDFILEDARNRLILAAHKVLEMVDS